MGESQDGAPLVDLPADRDAYVRAARERAETLYAGVVTPHRSCGVALAETFGLPTPSYQALRRGGVTGAGPCGAVAAGVLVLGEILGDPDPTGAVTPALREAVPRFRLAVAGKIDHGVDTACDVRVAPLGDFFGERRKGYCTTLAAVVAETVAEVLWDLGRPVPLPPAPWAQG